MNHFTLSVKNYRAFSLDNPLIFDINENITFILGVNNVGKSALLRLFFELKPFIHVEAIRSSRGTPKNRTFQVPLPFDRICNRKTPNHPITIEMKSGDSECRIEISPHNGDPHSGSFMVRTFCNASTSEDFFHFTDELFHRSMYIGSFRSASSQVNDSMYDLQIGQSFISLWDSWSNGERVDHSNEAEELVEELRVLFGFNKFSISVSQNKQDLYISTDDGRFLLRELGDGIAHYILALGNAMTKSPSFIFIDEPEIGLHPKMQEVFVRTLALKAKIGLIATSHSVGLARSVADKIVTITRDAEGKRHCLPFGEHRKDSIFQSISELGYSQYAELGGNHLLLVEGRTDIKSFREILRIFKMEKNFLIWSLNGSDWLRASPEKIIEELSDLKRLNAASISVIFDSERTSADMAMADVFSPFYQLCLDLGFNVFPTDRHSTENYISQEALDLLLPGKKALTQFEVFGSNGPKWDKSKNWLLFQKMRATDFNDTGLKHFITETLASIVAASETSSTSSASIDLNMSKTTGE